MDEGGNLRRKRRASYHPNNLQRLLQAP